MSMDPFLVDVHPDKAETPKRQLDQRHKLELADKATQAYLQLVENAQSWLLGRLAECLRTQDLSAAEASRVEVIQINKEGKTERLRPTSSDELRKILDGTASGPAFNLSSSGPSQTKPESFTTRNMRRIFIVEDVSRNYMGVLGSRLRITPAFFARHLLELSVLEQLEDDDTEGGNIQSFKLPFFQFGKAPKVLQPSLSQALEELYRVKANVTRLFAFPRSHGTFDLRGTIIEIEHCFSFWSNTRKDDSWDVVILVDPPLKDEALSINSQSKIVFGNICRCSYIPKLSATSQLPKQPNSWPKLEMDKGASSFFDELSDYFQQKSFVAPTDPFHCSQHLRQIALRGWNDFLNHAMHCLVLTKGEPYPDNAHFSSPTATLWALTVEEWLLGRMVKWSRRLHIEATVLSTIIRGFGISPISALGGGHGNLATGKLSSTEAKNWALIREKTLEYKSLYDDMASSYMQVCSLRESLTSNQQARSVGRLSSMGALFVPISLSATILSMAEPFTPGKDRFWVFFAVGVPFLLLLSLWLFIQPSVLSKKGLASSNLDPQEAQATDAKMPLGKYAFKGDWGLWQNRFTDARSSTSGA